MTRHKRRRRGLLAPALALAMLVSTPAALAGQPRHPVAGWVRHNAAPLEHVDPAAPLDDLAPLRRAVGDAWIVGLGESVHGAAEQQTLKHRTVRMLVEQLGFRSIAWEEQWTTGLAVDEYLRTGEGDLAALVRGLGPQWQSREMTDTLRWLRDFNAGRADKVRFVGVEYYLTGLAAYTGVDTYVAHAAPGRHAELLRHLKPITPRTGNIDDHITWFEALPAAEQQAVVDDARRVHDLVAGLPGRPGHAVALRHARQILSFFEHLILPEPDTHTYRDARTAQTVRWWQELTGDKVAYWAASPHTANAPRLRIALPPEPDLRFAAAGSHLRQWYGRRYLSIGFTFDHGAVRLTPDLTVPQTPPKPHWFERPFGETGIAQFTLDLRRPAPPAVREWLRAPATTRGMAHAGPESYVDGGSLGQWFDVIVHRQEVTPMRPAPVSPDRGAGRAAA
ncbi:erythromycin esterase family protein [Amycolatopsis suaedae]|uniref:Erythromycin esterase family protein n=1 Tax=Amycolatopsis suaedae TaxID=2510978 RepID=A0A4Q7J457_9PSEU|nr:erythromycin esterase family protein [Amycolatopsis suaedae]RZQ61456.1 erythromycin esterase family protein [Amycolatopsis suaedae]